MISMSRRLAATASILSALAVGAPVAVASAATGSTPAGTASIPGSFALPTLTGLWPSSLTFVPPNVPAIRVDIGAIIISGKVISPGLHVSLPGITLPPIVFGPGG
jgi:hypothetical protein